MQVERELRGSGVELVVVGFSPSDALAALGAHLGIDGPVLVDQERVLYRRLGLPRAPVWRVYSPATLAFYVRARGQGRPLRRPVEDTRQLGGDALVVDGVVGRVWRPGSPDDRVAPARLAAAARAAVRG